MKTDDMPGPAGSLLLGSARELLRDQVGAYERAMHQYGEAARFRIGPRRLGFEFDAVFTPAAAREVLATHAADYVKEAPIFTEFSRLIGNGLLTSNGERWRRDRRLIAPLFTPRRIRSYVEPTAGVATGTVDGWLANDPCGGVLSLRDVGFGYALEVLGTTVFGTNVADAAPTLRSTIPVLSDHAARRGLAPVRVPASWPTPANRAAARAQAQLYELVDHLIAERRRSVEAGDDLLGRLISARDPETGAGLDDQEVRDQVLIFLIGGHETAAGALALTLHLLGRHPDIQERVHDEVRAVVGDAAVGADDLKRLTYTGQVVDEVLRIYPPGHTLVRTAATTTELVGREVPAGRIVAVSIWAIHHNPDVWSEPHRFDPDRFAPDHNGDAPRRDRYAHLPFGGGPRSCIGEHLARAELVIGAATVLRSCRLRSLVEDPKFSAGVTFRPDDPLPCWVEPWDRDS